MTVLPRVSRWIENGVKYKTASGEALCDQGEAVITGILPGGHKRLSTAVVACAYPFEWCPGVQDAVCVPARHRQAFGPEASRVRQGGRRGASQVGLEAQTSCNENASQEGHLRVMARGGRRKAERKFYGAFKGVEPSGLRSLGFTSRICQSRRPGG